jgi:hypothetical protein
MKHALFERNVTCLVKIQKFTFREHIARAIKGPEGDFYLLNYGNQTNISAMIFGGPGLAPEYPIHKCYNLAS